MIPLWFITEANPRAGSGHLSRCLAIAGAAGPGFSVHFFMNRNSTGYEELLAQKGYVFSSDSELSLPEAKDAIIVVDSYSLTEQVIRKLRDRAGRLIVLDDFKQTRPLADVVIYPAGNKDRVSGEGSQIILQGPAWMPVRPEFTDAASMTDPSPGEGILLVPGSNISADEIDHLISACETARPGEKITVVSDVQGVTSHGTAVQYLSGLSAGRMAELLRSHSLVIASASVVAYEACTVRAPLIVIRRFPNQDHVFRFLLSSGICTGTDDVTKLNELILQFDPTRRKRQVELQKKYFDGKAAVRIKELLECMAYGPRLRRVQKEDAVLLLDWANDPVTRKNSYHPGPVSPEGHKEWFRGKMKEKDCRMWIIEENEPAGVVRTEREGDEFELSITIAPSRRGKGLAARSLKLAFLHFITDFPGQALHAWIRKENAASVKAFSSAGFIFVKEEMKKGAISVKMMKTC